MQPKIAKVKEFFHSIQGQFILFSLSGAVILLLVSSVLSYIVISDTVQRINERATLAEFSQISVNLQGVLDNAERQSEIILGNDSVKKLCTNTYENKVERIFSINEFSRLVTDMVRYYPYIHSVYLYLDNNEVLCATSVNMQCTVSNEELSDLIRHNSGTRQLLGGIRAGDFPLENKKMKEDEYLISTVWKIYSGWLVINISEEYFCSLYSDISQNQESMIRIMDSDGNILSSPKKDELGGLYEYIGDIHQETESKKYSAQGGAIQILWLNLENDSIVIVSERKVSVLYEDISMVSQTVVITFILGLAILCLVFFRWMQRSLLPLKYLINSMESVADTGEYRVITMKPEYEHVTEVYSLMRHYNRMLNRLNEFKVVQERTAEELRRRELQVLRNQINPHFLFNTLNNIKWMSIASGVPNITESITALGRIVQPLFRSDAVTWSLKEELEQVHMYLKIENLRFQNGIQYQEKIPPELVHVKILRFILQPLIENSITHGFSAHSYRGNIWIRVYTRDENLFIEVADNGQGLSSNALEELKDRLNNSRESGGIGLFNTYRRIQLYYGSPYGISVCGNEQEDTGLTTVLMLPLVREENRIVQ